MNLTIKPSDLYYKYRRNTARRDESKFCMPPDPTPFDRDDLYEVLPMLGAAMTALGRDDMQTLHRLEEVLVRELPGFITTRDEVFAFLVGCGRELLADVWP